MVHNVILTERTLGAELDVLRLDFSALSARPFKTILMSRAQIFI